MPQPGDMGPSWFAIAIDTAAPTLVFGAAQYQVNQGEELRVEFTLNEPDVLSAVLRVNGQDYAMIVQNTGLDYEAIITPTVSGQGTVIVTVRDDVWNQATYSVPVAIAEVVEPPPPPPVTPALPGISVPAVQRHEDKYDIEYRVVVRNADRVPVAYTVSVKDVVALGFSVIQHNEDRNTASVYFSDRVATLKREDEEILLLI